MRKIKGSYGVWSVSILIVILAIILLLPSILTRTEPVACEEMPLVFAPTEKLACAKRTWLAGSFFVASFNSLGAAEDAPILFSRSPTAVHFSLFGQSIGGENSVTIVRNSDNQNLVRTFGTGTDWSAGARTQLIFPIDPMEIYRIHQAPNKAAYELYMTSPQKEIMAPPNKSQNLPVESQRIRFISTISLLLIAFGAAYAYKSKRLSAYLYCLTACFLVLTIYCGMPYGSIGGWYDPGDDKSYVQWTYNLGYLLDPYLYHSNLHSWAQGSNHHIWGTGLLLAPFVLPIHLLGLPPQVSTPFLGLMSNGVILLALFSVLLYFLAFRRIAKDLPAMFAALGTVACTSMLKWTYMRNFFSHSPEAFTIALATYGFVGRHFTKDRKKSDFIILLLGFFLAVQVRRENLGFLPLLVCLEVFGTIHQSLKSDLRGLKTKLLPVLAIILTAIGAEIVIRFTGYFTDLKRFAGANAAGSYLHIDKIGHMFGINGYDVLAGESFGLFYWKNLFVYLGIAAVLRHIKSYRVWMPMVATVAAFLLLCILYDMPNGVEWQNRFLLKLNPIFFGAAALLMSEKNRFIKIIASVALAAAAYFELQLYYAHLPHGMTFFVYQFGDVSLKFPQMYPGASMYLFYFPLICMSGLALLFFGWSRWKRT